MFYIEWKPIYEKIAKDLNFLDEKENLAADNLNKILQKKKLISIKEMEDFVAGKEVVVFGAGPTLESSIISNKKLFIEKLKITADGATSALLKNNILPDIIVTDLDGKISDQIEANSKGSKVVIHAHGDNIDKVKRFVSEFKRDIMGTTQINPGPYDNLYNFGGFTDGDRAIYLADFFGAKKIFLIAFDFNKRFGKYSFPDNKNKILKLKKLKWCEYLIKLIIKKNKNIYFL